MPILRCATCLFYTGSKNANSSRACSCKAPAIRSWLIATSWPRRRPGTRKLIFNNLKKIPRGNTPIIPARATANAPVQDVETFEFDARTSIDIDIG